MRLGLIVEGTNDERAISLAMPEVATVSTKGTRLNNAILAKIDLLKENTDVVYIMTDPDRAGDVMAERLANLYDFERVELDSDKCKHYVGRGKWKYGVEHASCQYLREVLKNLL